jgi:hypothetical protein
MKAEKRNYEFDTVDVMVGHIWKTVVQHSRKGHRLRLEVDDDDQTLWCLFCKHPIVGGSEDVMQRCGEKMKASAIEFEVIITTNQNHH